MRIEELRLRHCTCMIIHVDQFGVIEHSGRLMTEEVPFTSGRELPNL
jgi:hypothetical protein